MQDDIVVGAAVVVCELCLSVFRLYYTNTYTIESYDLMNGDRVAYGRQSQNNFVGVALYQVILIPLQYMLS